MANEEHLKILSKGVGIWNQWREMYPALSPDLSGAILQDFSLSNADLSKANLSKANLSFSRLISAKLQDANLQEADLSYAVLRHTHLSKANLRKANLYNTDLFHADLHGAILLEANLNASQVLNTDFTGVIFTGVCIANWQIGSSTTLEDVVCDYIFRTIDEEGKFSGRLPVDSNSTLASGEFELWAEVRASALETIDLTFLDGIDWQDFFNSLQDVRSQNPDTGIILQGVEERKGRYVVQLRLETEKTGRDRKILEARIETTTKELYEIRRQLDKAHGEIKALDRSLEKALNRPTYDFRYSQWAGGFAEKVFGNQSGGTLSTHAAPEQQITIGSIAEILALLQQLGQTNPMTTLEEKTAFVNMAIPPNRRERLLWVLQSVGEDVLQELPYGNAIKAIIEGWQEPG